MRRLLLCLLQLSLFTAILITAPATAGAQAQCISSPSAAKDESLPLSSVERALRSELDRGLRELRLPGTPAPYYASASLTDEWSASASATLGAIMYCRANSGRTLSASIRVGDYDFDNTNFLGGVPPGGSVRLAMSADADSLRRSVWLAMDQGFKAASSSYEAKRAARQAAVARSSKVGSFTRVPPVREVISTARPFFEATELARLVRGTSRLFRSAQWVQNSGAIATALHSRHLLTDTEGSFVVESRTRVVVIVWGALQTPDGTWATQHRMAWGGSLAELSTLGELESMTLELIGTLKEHRDAPVATNYTGPVLFEGTATGQLFDHLLAAQLTGTPAPETPIAFGSHSPALLDRIGLRLLPSRCTILDDPSRSAWRRQPLTGHYRYDDEGIAGETITIVERGRLVGLPMSRTPSAAFSQSNGHGRIVHADSRNGVVSNLIVGCTNGLSRGQLKRRLLRIASEEGLQHGYIVRELHDSFVERLATAGRPTRSHVRPGALPPPVRLYRVWPDGREQLVRGGSIDALRLANLRDIIAASKEQTLYHSTELAFAAASESGGGQRPGLSIVAPDVLIREADVLAPQGPRPRLPILPRPSL